jgi:glyoxylase-like metal-dependent hydrolase (beta-lactamase superfamily II)
MLYYGLATSGVFLGPLTFTYNEGMHIESIIVGQLDTNCVIITDTKTRDACVIDPGDDPEKITTYIDANNLRPAYILFTHAHYDHVCAARELKEKYHAGIVMHEDEKTRYEDTKKLCMSWGYDEEDFPLPDLYVRDGDVIEVGNLRFSVIHTPGHTPGSICLFGNGVLVTGDTLFRGSAGRTDLPGGNSEHLLRSLKKLMRLPDTTRVLCGHDHETTIRDERETNPFMVIP